MYKNEVLESEPINAPEKMNIFQRLGNLFFHPKKLFAYIAKKPNILLPVIILCIVSLLSQVLMADANRDFQLDTAYSTYQNMGIQYSIDEIDSLINIQVIATIVSIPFIMVAAWLISTLILYLIFRLASCEKGLKKYFSMIGFISIISALGQLLQGLYVYLTGAAFTSPQVTSLSSLIDAESVGNFLYGLASNIEIFNIWTYILYGIGFIYTGGVKKKTSYIFTTVLFAVTALVTAGTNTLLTNFLEGLNFSIN